MHGLIAALWLSLAPPVEGPAAPEPALETEAATFDEVVDIAPPSEPAPTPEQEPASGSSIQPAPQAPVAVPHPEAPPRAMRRQLGKAEPWRGNWRGWGAPLLSAFVPGLGQIANGDVLKGVGLIYGTVASLVGAIALYRSPNDGTRPLGSEYARLAGYGLLSTMVPMLWRFAVIDAYRVANGKDLAQPKLDHQLRLSLSRTMVVGFRADPDRPGFYDEWSGSMMGQVARRWSVGVSDLALKPEDWRISVVQFGGRIDYRVFDRRRLWIDVALGTALQVKIRRPEDPLDPDALPGRVRTKFGAVPYAQVDLRWFMLDRISFDVTPRLSVPVTTRYFSAGRALPRFAPTLELGASASLYF